MDIGNLMPKKKNYKCAVFCFVSLFFFFFFCGRETNKLPVLGLGFYRGSLVIARLERLSKRSQENSTVIELMRSAFVVVEAWRMNLLIIDALWN